MLFVLFWFLAKSHFSSFYLASVFYSTFFDFGYSFSLLLLLFVFTFSSLIIRVHLPPFLLNDKKFFFYNENFYASHYVKSFFVSFLLYVFWFSLVVYIYLFFSCYSRLPSTFSPRPPSTSTKVFIRRITSKSFLKLYFLN